MPLLNTLVHGLSKAPGYTLMRGAARFDGIRSAVTTGRRTLHASRVKGFLQERKSRIDQTVFTGVNPEAFVQTLGAEGAAFGLQLPDSMVTEIKRYANEAPCYADRENRHGFLLSERETAEKNLKKAILVAQYFNAARDCPAIERLTQDPLLQWIAGSYLGSLPTLVGVNLWWTFPVNASDEDRDRHAHLFHRDVDDFRFFKFFFYLTDVQPGDGAHICVLGSHHQPPRRNWADHWKFRRYSDAEVAATYAPDTIREVCGPAGIGFAENTLCIHKGSTPVHNPRLLLQIQFALFDYGAMHDRRDSSMLARIA